MDSKTKADKLVKDIIKIIVKTGVLFHNKQIPEAEIKNWEILRSKIINILMTVTYFHATPFTYNGEMLSKQFESEEKLLNEALKEWLVNIFMVFTFRAAIGVDHLSLQLFL